MLSSTVDNNGYKAVSKIATNVSQSAVCFRFQPKLNFLGDIIVKKRNIKFHENPSSGNQVVLYERTNERTNERKGQEDNMKLIFDVCVTVRHQYNDVSNQQDATTLSFINLQMPNVNYS